ncbi:MAG TPA: hypothetical protein PLG57_01585 [Bacteroidia bacterium]|jgi:hypothetical protein|nr:hypothetical protein [Bacteroidia bacterium]HQF27677.1 hypothetical protein [Bacteroidia bacterium]HQK97169.1 hypothetical protein [Bacteroidia bacterium]
MANILNEDFVDFLEAFNKFDVEYILVGGYAVIFHGYNRTTGDLDVWVKKTPGNFQKIKKAFFDFGMSLFNLDEKLFLNTNINDVFTFGRPPVCIDVLTSVKGLEFNEAFENSKVVEFDKVLVRMIDFRDLMSAKRAANRTKDQDDIEHLESQRE